MIGRLIGELLREKREELGLTQKAVAKFCARAIKTISRLENGKIKDPPISLILSYCRALGWPRGSFFSELEEMEIKELLPKEVGEVGYPAKAKRRILRYALGMEYQKKGIISFPKYAQKRIEGILWRLTPEERGRYLSFAEEYFFGLKKRERLEPITERYKKLGLEPKLRRKVVKIIGQAYKRELKRAERKMMPDGRKRKILESRARYEEWRERFRERLKKLIFAKRGMTTTHLQVYHQVGNWFYKLLRNLKREVPLTIFSQGDEVSFTKISFPEIDQWREAVMEREKLDRKILNEVIRIGLEEYQNLFFAKE